MEGAEAVGSPVMEPVPHTELIRNETVRGLVGGITRHTLIAWRDSRGFPEPLDVDGLELWDRRQVRQWMQENRDVVKAAKRRKRP
jgi:hypothetical protein